MKHHVLLLFFLSHSLWARSPFRTPDPTTPIVTARWKGQKQGKTLINRYFRQHPLFMFGTKDILEDLIPDTISYANDPTQSVQKAELSVIINNGITEIKNRKWKLRRKKNLTDFVILQDKNFSYRNLCGLIVLKFKDYPFVAKVFMERPDTFLEYFIKGFEPIFFFYMTGGVNRHISGLTRAKNLKLMKKEISYLEPWNQIIEFPRKWYWLPENNQEIELIGENIIQNKTITTQFPSIYVIIADAVDTKNQIDIPTAKRKKIVMQFTNDVYTYLDPHFDNFIFHKDPTGRQPYKIIIVDTEHFPSITGFEKAKYYKNHHNWYINLANKCLGDIYLKTKYDLQLARTSKSPLCLDDPIFTLKEH